MKIRSLGWFGQKKTECPQESQKLKLDNYKSKSLNMAAKLQQKHKNHRKQGETLTYKNPTMQN